MKDSSPKTKIKFEPNLYPLNEGIRLIEASAGTGKTYALAHLVLRLIAEKKKKINEILVVSFTEAAATELKSRITNRIEKAIEGLDLRDQNKNLVIEDEVLKTWIEMNGSDPQKRRIIINLLAEALDSIDLADITTIHGFCYRTIKREALEIKASFNPILEETYRDLIMEIVSDYWNKEILALEPENLKGVIASGINIESLAKALELIDNDPSMNYKGELSKNDQPIPLKVYINQYLEKTWLTFKEKWAEQGEEFETDVRSLSKKCKDKGLKDTKPYSSKPLKDRSNLISYWIKEISCRSTKSSHHRTPYYGEVKFQELLGKYFHPSILNQVAKKTSEESFSKVKPELQIAISKLWDGPAEKVWDHALTWCTSELDNQKENRGLMSYGDLLKVLDPGIDNEVISLSNTKQKIIFEKLRKKYRVALIDEFQDTDHLQWRILKNTFGNSSEHLLLMVGDPKQSIYSFRGGDLKTYLKARDEVDRIDFLLDNFRTNIPLMNSLNQFLAKGLIRSGLETPILFPKSKKNFLILSNDQKDLQIIGIDKGLNNTNKESLESKSNIELRIPIAVTNLILDLLQKNPDKIRADDICILVSRHNQAADIRKNLSDAKIPSRLINQEDIFQTEAAQILQRFVDCIARPGDFKKLRLLACSPIMQWKLSKIQKEDNEELVQHANKFRYWSENFSKIGLMSCLTEILDSKTIADLSERGRILTDLNQCAQLLEEEIYSQKLNAQEASRWLLKQRHERVDVKLKDRQLHSELSESAVNILTIHRSKGLEYQIVICPYLWEVPPISKGPLWRSEENHEWVLAVNSSWGKGQALQEKAIESSLEESERSAYVAFTRACSKLFIFWANGAKQKGNPLIQFLFGPKAVKHPIEELTISKMIKWFKKQDIDISFTLAEDNFIKDTWVQPTNEVNLTTGPIPLRKLDTSWGRSSYSTWISNSRKDKYFNLIDPSILEDGKENYPISNASSEFLEKNMSNSNSSINWSKDGPLSKFPRGANAGTCLHKILEKVDITKSIYNEDSTKLIRNELKIAGLEENLINIVQEGISRVINVPLGKEIGNLKLKQLNSMRVMKEFNFDLPLAQKGNNVHAKDIAKVFTNDKNNSFLLEYSKSIESLNINSCGFFTGSIDLVFSDGENNKEARWWIADWKSNWIGNPIDSICGPNNYHREAMNKQMASHHYPLQAYLYLVALHRYLKWRLKEYSPKNNLGGYIYFFLRGLPEEDEIIKNKNPKEIPGIILEKASIELILELNSLIEHGK